MSHLVSIAGERVCPSVSPKRAHLKLPQLRLSYRVILFLPSHRRFQLLVRPNPAPSLSEQKCCRVAPVKTRLSACVSTVYTPALACILPSGVYPVFGPVFLVHAPVLNATADAHAQAENSRQFVGGNKWNNDWYESSTSTCTFTVRKCLKHKGRRFLQPLANVREKAGECVCQCARVDI